MGLLDGQIAIITGAGTGIGREAALMFANEGASLVLAGRRIEPLNEVVQLIESDGGTAIARSTDLEARSLAARISTAMLRRRSGPGRSTSSAASTSLSTTLATAPTPAPFGTSVRKNGRASSE